MSLPKCYECGKEIKLSTKEKCPHCGYVFQTLPHPEKQPKPPIKDPTIHMLNEINRPF